MKKLPIGEQNFDRIREDGQLYVDKTRQVFDLINYANYIFLSRPRRFGKSLLVGTLEAIFQGKKEMFQGLWIADKIEWESYPIIRLDFAGIPFGTDLSTFNESIMLELRRVAKEYEIAIFVTDSRLFLSELLVELHRQTGKRVVLLIDEYDKPITDHLTKPDFAEEIREWLRKFYEVLKGKSGHIHFLFMTGISKFSKMSIFSVLKNLKDISLKPEFNDIVGFTEADLDQYFAPYLSKMAIRENISEEVLREKVRNWYNGYSWSDGQQRIYNPWSIINLCSDLEFHNFWFSSGTPGFLIQLIRDKYATERDRPPAVEEFDRVPAIEQTFDSYDLRRIDLTALLFQAGYLTILEKQRSGDDTLYILGYPNHEVRWSMSAHVLEAFTHINLGLEIMPKAIMLRDSLRRADSEKFMLLIRSLFAGIPYDVLQKVNEYFYESAFYFLFNMLGIERLVLEKSSYHGKADGVLDWEGKVYVFEFKFARKGTMKALLDSAALQIKERGYHHPYLGSGKPVFLVAVGLLYKSPGKGKSAALTVDVDWKEAESL